MIRTKVKTLFMSLFYLATGSVIAQPEITVETDTIYAALDTLTNGELTVHWDVANNQFGTLDLMCTRTYVDLVDPYNYPYVLSTEENPVPGSYEKFCWGPICYDYGTDASSTNSGFLVSIPQNSVDTSFMAYFYPNGVTGTSTIEYCMHPVGNEAFGACATITYVITATAKVGYLEESVATISSVYPNPLHGEGMIDYNIPSGKIGRIVSRDISGKIIGSFEHLTSTGRVLISDSEYTPGLYFTTLEVNGVVVSTKRFVVAK